MDKPAEVRNVDAIIVGLDDFSGLDIHDAPVGGKWTMHEFEGDQPVGFDRFGLENEVVATPQQLIQSFAVDGMPQNKSTHSVVMASGTTANLLRDSSGIWERGVGLKPRGRTNR